MSKAGRASRRPWTEVELQLLRWGYADSLTADMARALGRGESSVYAKARELGLHKDPQWVADTARERIQRLGHGGAAHRFQKGHVPANKGLRRPGWAPGAMATTQFKPGNRPHTWKPVGSYRITPEGDLQQKTQDTGYPPRDWVSVRRLVWEATHGPIPEGHIVRFKDGCHTTDPDRITIERLELVTRAENMRRNNVHATCPPELARLSQLRGVLTRAINQQAKAKAEADQPKDAP